MRLATVLIAAVFVTACSPSSATAPPSSTHEAKMLASDGPCLLGASYERDTQLSQRISEYLFQNVTHFMDSPLPVSVLSYPDQSGAAFRYQADCDTARRHARSAFEHLADRSDDPEVASALREVNWREISQAEFENSGD